MSERVFVTGMGAVCAAGKDPDTIWDAVRAGRSAIAPIRQWDTSRWPRPLGGEIGDFDPYALVHDRKLHKLIRRSDVLGLYAGARAIDGAALTTYRDSLDESAVSTFSDRTAVYVGSGGSAFQDQYDFFPLLTHSRGDLVEFGRALTQTVHPMWLLRTLPNNVLCHIGITYGFRGPNACITNHSVSGPLAVAEAMAALRSGEADRALAIGHDAPIEPQLVQYYGSLNLLTADAVRPFDAKRSGSVLGEGAAALTLETESAARARGGARLRGDPR